MTIGNKNSNKHPHLFGCYSYQERQVWSDHFSAVIHAAADAPASPSGFQEKFSASELSLQ
jgi:hypothetical protein